MTELLPNIFAIKVPEGAKDFQISVGWLEYYNPQKIEFDGQVWIALGNSYEILFTTKGVSEEQAGKVVDSHWDTELGAMRFGVLSNNSMDNFLPTEALKSLLRSKGLTGANYLIIKKAKQ